MIKYILFDADNTLLDFDMSMFSAEKAVADRYGVEFTESYFSRTDKMVRDDWDLFLEDQAEIPGARDEWHERYRDYLLKYFDKLNDQVGIDIDPQELMEIHLSSIAAMHHTMEKETLEVYIELASRYPISIASNSLAEIRGRISPFVPYSYKIFISDEVGAVKPDRVFFDTVIKELDCSPAECLMIGDSAYDDMMGAKEAGLRTCWYRFGKSGAVCEYADYTIDSITELPSLLDEICRSEEGGYARTEHADAE